MEWQGKAGKTSQAYGSICKRPYSQELTFLLWDDTRGKDGGNLCKNSFTVHKNTWRAYILEYFSLCYASWISMINHYSIVFIGSYCIAPCYVWIGSKISWRRWASEAVAAFNYKVARDRKLLLDRTWSWFKRQSKLLIINYKIHRVLRLRQFSIKIKMNSLYILQKIPLLSSGLVTLVYLAHTVLSMHS